MVSFGISGPLTELLEDRSYRIPPLGERDAEAMVREIKAAPILFGYRGSEAVDVAEVERLVQRVAQLQHDIPQVASLDLALVLAGAEGLTVLTAFGRVEPVADPRSDWFVRRLPDLADTILVTLVEARCAARSPALTTASPRLVAVASATSSTSGASASVARMASPTYERLKLRNGLRVVLAPDRSAPVVAVAVYYDVGIRSEPQGRTGFAHLFEHLMFQGSASLGKMELVNQISASGGVLNGSTRLDYTNYYEMLPSNALDRALFLEADRMGWPAVTEENLANQIAVVKEEIRVNVLNEPYGGFPWLTLAPVLYET